jgi:glycosyltransferase involved in cell wall biosynthesis
MKKISVVIPSYNSAATIAYTLKALRRQTRPELLREILVVDSSDDGRTPAVLEAEAGADLRVIRPGSKTMPGPGRNLGAREAKGEVLAFVDSDAFPDDDWLERIAENEAAGFAVGGGSVTLPDFQRRKPVAVAQYYLQFNEFTPHGVRRPAAFTPSVNLYCERGLFDRAGGFPDLRASEDVLFGLNVNRLRPMIFDPAVRVSHIFREDAGAFLRNQAMLGRYVIVYRRLFYKRWLYRGLWPVLLFPFFLAVKCVRMLGRIVRALKPADVPAFIMALPHFLLGLVWWSGGFLKGCVSHEAG